MITVKEIIELHRDNVVAFILSGVAAGMVWYLSKDFILFWDTVQFGAKHPLYFLNSNFNSILLPDHIDSGHPTFFGLYLALWLRILGTHLWVLHLAMLPIVMTVIFMTYKLGKLFFYQEYYYVFIMMGLCPMILGHIVLVSPDVLLLAGLMVLLYGFFGSKSWIVMLGSLLLCLVSLRGGAIVFGVFIVDFFTNQKVERKTFQWTYFIQTLLPFLPGVVMLFSFLVYHYLSKNWLAYHDDSPWAASFELVSLKDFIKNILVFIWRILDLGMIAVYIPIIYLLVKKQWTDRTRKLLYIWIVLVITLAILTLPYQGLLNHRYFMALHVIAIVILVEMILFRVILLYRRLLIFPITIFMFLGSIWVYPQHIARAWDVTPLHWYFYDAELQMNAYIQTEDIDVSQVATVFPLLNTQHNLKLNNILASYTEVDLDCNEYVLFSNIMNDFSQEQILKLREKWECIHKTENGPIYLTLYKAPTR